GYISPEYALNGLFSVKSNVFSFGVILLEIVGGKKNWGFYHKSSSSNLLKYLSQILAHPKNTVQTLIFMGCNRALSILVLFVTFDLFSSLHALETITGTQFMADDENRSLVSSDGNFKLGFFSPGKSQARYVGIWFNKIPEQTVVWVANRETPIRNSAGIFKIGGDGNLAVFCCNQSSPLWSTNVSMPAQTSTAKLLNSGNLVLVAKETIIWQSFDYPTDTILPGMKFGWNRKTGLNRILTSWKSIDDPTPGEFSSGFDPHSIPQIFLYKNSVPHWRSGIWNGRILNGMIDVGSPKDYFSDQIDFINVTFVSKDNEIYIKFAPKKVDVFSIVVLESMGFLNRLIWHESQRWVKVQVTPQDMCDEYMRCGANAICDEDTFPHCACLPGFKRLYPQDWYLKCQETRKETCGKGDGEGFVRLKGVKFPDARNSILYNNMSLEECERECLKSCNCAGYANVYVDEMGRDCIAWYGELQDMRHYKSGQDFYHRVDAVELGMYCLFFHNSGLNSMLYDILFNSFTSFSSTNLFVFYFDYVLFYNNTGKKKQQCRQKLLFDSERSLSNYRDSSNTNSSASESGNIEITFFELNAVIAATENFSSANKLGRGGFGPVFKGQLANGQEIAVKRLSSNSGQGIEEFKNEVLLIAKLQHRNLVRLLGCCIEKDEKMLIYEFMPNKSLDYFIFDQSRKLLLDWKSRFEIILGIARGIIYLHQDSRLRIVHRDLKASNILLDGEMKPKISDFGTARIVGGDEIQENTKRVVGTFGYMSPEYALGGLFSVKSDVFSFGVILLEIISGKKNWGFYHESSSSNLLKYIWELWRDNKTLKIVDLCISNSCPVHDEVLRCIQVGLLCVQDDARDRPTMSNVVFMLCNEATLPCPKQSTFSFRRRNAPESSTKGTNCSANEVTITTLNAR
ncbi:hypothetical protein Dsin_027774, partial [Dipteronia sinensis]